MTRKLAKIVGFVELVRETILCIGFLVFLVAVFLPLAWAGIVLGDKDYKIRNLGLLFIVLALLGTALLFQIYITQLLLTACKPNCEVTAALENGCFWRNGKIVLLLFYPFGFYLAPDKENWLVILPITLIIWDIMAMLMVQKFLDKLELKKQSLEVFVTGIASAADAAE